MSEEQLIMGLCFVGAAFNVFTAARLKPRVSVYKRALLSLLGLSIAVFGALDTLYGRDDTRRSLGPIIALVASVALLNIFSRDIGRGK